MSEQWKPQFIQLPIDKMAGAPWNLLDYRGFRIALCGTDGNHEKDGEKIANDLLNLVAIGEAVGELHEEATRYQGKLEELIRYVYDQLPQGELRNTVYMNAARIGLSLGKREGDSA